MRTDRRTALNFYAAAVMAQTGPTPRQLQARFDSDIHDLMPLTLQAVADASVVIQPFLKAQGIHRFMSK